MQWHTWCRELTGMHCVYLVPWTRKVLCGSFLCTIYINFHLFIHIDRGNVLAKEKVGSLLNCPWMLVMKHFNTHNVQLRDRGVQYTTLTHMKGSTSFNATPNTCITFRAHSHMAIAHFSCIIVNAATDCYSPGQALALNAGVQYTMHTKGSISFSSTPNTA